MKEKGWCARPEIKFRRNKDGGVEGYAPSKSSDYIRVGELF